ncbi:cyclin-T-like [Microplitis mediator]|uniref:cyclin-T-like n=1 Tax=Microplitis mediator TaxID=375433 RepID=UPI0025536BD9|nr:cyclin-T-like [Microplitis mediator]
MARSNWYFNNEELMNSPSFRDGINADKELDHKQQAAYLINDLGTRLKLSQDCINTATVFMHRFYTQKSLSQFHRYEVATTVIFLAAKVKKVPQKIEDVIRALHTCLNKDKNHTLDITTAEYQEEVNTIICNECFFLLILGFNIEINHPHDYILKFCRTTDASRELRKVFLHMATYSLQLTPMCLKYKPAVVACFCIYFTAQSSQWKIIGVSQEKPWFWFFGPEITCDLLIRMEKEFREILGKVSSQIRNRVMNLFKVCPSGQVTLASYPDNSSEPLKCTRSVNEVTPPRAARQQISRTRRTISYQEYLDRKKLEKLAKSDDESSTSSSNATEDLQDNSVGSKSIEITPTTINGISADPKISISEIADSNDRKRKHDTNVASIFSPAKQCKYV